MDADPNHPIKTWAGGGNTPGRLSIVSDANEGTIMCELPEHALDALELLKRALDALKRAGVP